MVLLGRARPALTASGRRDRGHRVTGRSDRRGD